MGTREHRVDASGDVARWVCAHLALPVPEMLLPSIEFRLDGARIGAVSYWSPHWPQIAVANIFTISPKWATRSNLRHSFRLPFREWGVKRLHCDVDIRNERSKRFLMRLGFTQEGVLRCAGYRGEDIVVFSMMPWECKWV